MFNTEWWHSKNQSKELTLGWIYNNHIKNDFAKGYTKNLTDYWSVEMASDCYRSPKRSCQPPQTDSP